MAGTCCLPAWPSFVSRSLGRRPDPVAHRGGAVPRRGAVAPENRRHRAGRPGAQRPVPHGGRRGQVLDETRAPRPGAVAPAQRRRPGDRQRHRAGRWPLRRAFSPVGRGQGQDLGGQSYVVPQGDLRLAAHRIADFIYEKLTGEKGVFSTRIAYVTKAGQRYSLWVADADGENAQSALSSPEPIISPAWSPDGAQLAYVSFESRKPVIYAHDVASRQAPAAGQLPRLQQRTGLVARRAHAGGHAQPRWRLAALHHGRQWRRAAPLVAIGQHRHRAGLLARRQAVCSSSAIAAARRRSTAWRLRAATPSASPSTAPTTSRPASARTAAGWPTSPVSAGLSSCM